MTRTPTTTRLAPGAPVGWLRVTRYGVAKTQCLCTGGGVYKCDRVIMRSTAALRAALLKSADAKCKECERQERRARWSTPVSLKAALALRKKVREAREE